MWARGAGGENVLLLPNNTARQNHNPQSCTSFTWYTRRSEMLLKPSPPVNGGGEVGRQDYVRENTKELQHGARRRAKTQRCCCVLFFFFFFFHPPADGEK